MSYPEKFMKQLTDLLNNGLITDKEFNHFVNRGVQYITFSDEYPELKSLLPNGIPVGASTEFINKLNIPYQETSYIAANCNPKSEKKRYIYKTKAKAGGVVNLAGGKRPFGDNVFASLNRILVGNQADIISADNLVENKEQIWNWHFFGDNLGHDFPEVYLELEKIAEKKLQKRNPTLVVLARKKDTFDRLKIVELYKKSKISSLLPENDSPVIFMTNKEGYEFASKNIPEEKGLVSYISHETREGEIDIIACLRELRQKQGIRTLLNDGGRVMSNAMKNIGVLGGERITYESYPGEDFIPDHVCDSPDYLLGEEGTGLDGSELESGLELFSSTPSPNSNNAETFKLHVYPMSYSYHM